MSKSPKKLKFEDAIRRLDEIVAAMESGETEIEESIAHYEEAMRLASHCREILDRAELRIRQIQADAAGNPRAAPFDPTASAADDDDEHDAADA